MGGTFVLMPCDVLQRIADVEVGTPRLNDIDSFVGRVGLFVVLHRQVLIPVCTVTASE